MRNWEPTPVEKDYNNLTLWTDPSRTNNGDAGYIRAEGLNADVDSPIRTMDEQIEDPYPHSVFLMCTVNVNHRHAYLNEPETVPYFTREWEQSLDMPADPEETHIHKCNVTERYSNDVNDEEDSSDDEEDESNTNHKYRYTIELEVRKVFDETETITESHEITDVPRDAFSFANIPYTSDVFLKQSFRHEMKLPDEIFPKAWMNLIPKEEGK